MRRKDREGKQQIWQANSRRNNMTFWSHASFIQNLPLSPSATCQICPSCRAKDVQAKRGKRPGHLSVCPSTLNNFGCFGSAEISPSAPPPAHCQPTYCRRELAIFVKFPGLALEIKANGQWPWAWRRKSGAEDVAPNPLFPLAGLRQSQLQAKSRQKICWQKPT